MKSNPANTIDQAEIEYYDRLADQWWDQHGKFWPLHRLNALRVDYLVQNICQFFSRDSTSSLPLSGLNIVDIGCGGGILSESMAKHGANVHGIDVVEKSLRVASKHAQTSDLDITYELAEAEEIANRGKQYDVVLNMEVVEHVANLDSFMDSCCRLMKPGGITFIATINRNPVAWFSAIFAAEYILRWLPKGTHHWQKLVKPKELESQLKRSQFIVNDIIGVKVNPLNRQFSLTNNLMINYMLTATRRSPST